MQRLFLAIELPDAVKKTLLSACCGVPGARWMTEDQLHLTLVFLGQIDATTAADLDDALSEVTTPPFTMSIKGVGHFPPRGEPRILWAGVEKDDTLTLLQKRLQSTCERLGLDIEKRKFTPHITLARLRAVSIDDVGQFIQTYNLLRCEPFEVREFQLISSALNPKGARYAIEAAYPLEGESS